MTTTPQSPPVDIGTLIVRTPGTVGGRPRIRDTRVSVDHIAVLWNQGLTPERIIQEWHPELSLGEVFAALAYYHNNKAAIDRSILEEELGFVEGSLDAMRDPSRYPWLTEEQRIQAIQTGEERAAVLRQRLG